ncbi:MAG TPA: SDR family NAD(P)-dependent oxidoreductase, partial [Labilithrix sp.]
MELKDRVAIVTGSLGLLGREHLRALGAAGASLVVTDADEKKCEGLAKELGPNAIGVGADVTSRADLERLRDRTIESFGRIDVLVNNAAIDDKGPGVRGQGSAGEFESFPLESFKKALDVNVTGVFLACQVLGSVM